MPLGHPSQAQTGAAKFIEGLFTGGKVRMDEEHAGQSRKAYLDALYAGKPKTDPIALEREKQAGRKEILAMKPKPEPKGSGKGFAPLPVPSAAVQQAAAEARRLAEEADPLRGDAYQKAYNTGLMQRLQGLVEANTKNNELRIGRKLRPDEIVDAAMLAAQVGEVVPGQAPWFQAGPFQFGAQPPVVGPVAPGGGGSPLGADGKPLW